MASVLEHYAHHLAPLYVWMAGGVDTALACGAQELDDIGLQPGPGATVIDLGAGFGMHAVPLARRGAKVLAMDTSSELLQTLSTLKGSLPIRIVNDDLLKFPQHMDEAPDAILCMGDTMAHLPDLSAVAELLAMAAAALRRGGLMAVTLRDQSEALVGDRRFIPVRSDDDRILTCFLEYEPHRVVVHDLVQQRTAEGWSLKVSHYRKLRLSSEVLTTIMESNGFRVRKEAGLKGLIRIVGHLV